MRNISKASYAIALIAAVVATASAADARSYRTYDGAYARGDSAERSIPAPDSACPEWSCLPGGPLALISGAPPEPRPSRPGFLRRR